MILRIVLDTSILGKLCHPTSRKNRPVVEWVVKQLRSGAHDFFLPEMADYELRRKLLHEAVKDPSWGVTVKRLDDLCQDLEYVPLTTIALREAAALWAKARSQGHVTAPTEALDGDVILAAQALSVGPARVWTTNLKDLEFFVPVVTTEALLAS